MEPIEHVVSADKELACIICRGINPKNITLIGRLTITTAGTKNCRNALMLDAT